MTVDYADLELHVEPDPELVIPAVAQPGNIRGMTFEQLVIAILSGTIGAGTLIAMIRLLGPLAQKLVGGLLRTRAELDADRDRIILNLRAEIDDHARRLKECEIRRTAAIGRVDEQEKFIDQLLRHLGLDRATIEANGGAIPSRRQRRTTRRAS